MAEHLKQRAAAPSDPHGEVREVVSEILLTVEREGARAVRRYSEKFDRWQPHTFRVSTADADAAGDKLAVALRRDIDFARQQVERFARLQRDTLNDLDAETAPGVHLGHRHIPVAAVGSYTPGGRYPLIASALMTVATARAAGVERIVACCPPAPGVGGIHPAQLYALISSGADEIFCLGGVQALAAMAFGIDELEPVDMIVGAGNAFVAEAKRQLFGRVGIDLLAGPTEILVIADESANPKIVAADLLGQAEHGLNSPATLVTNSRELGQAVIEKIDTWLHDWPTAEIAGGAWRALGEVIVCDTREEMLAVSDTIAPEHLELQTVDDEWFAARLRNYGSLFIGESATVVYSDKAIGTNHVLPTGRAARYTGGLWVGKFLKTVTYQRVEPSAAVLVAPAAASIAEAEGMLGHAVTARLRLPADVARTNR
jgi:sulfopropanediol 3-dehydrogenase